MQIGFFTDALPALSLESIFAFLDGSGVTAVELSTRRDPASAHIQVDELLRSDVKVKEFQKRLADHGMVISAFSCHGNPVHPQFEIAQRDHAAFEKAVLLAEKLGVGRVNTFSGCPGDCPVSMYPNWVVCPWPDDFLTILDYQWNGILLPYWQRAAAFAAEHGIRVCIEMHPGFCVYNPETLLRLRGEIGQAVGANFDPSHLFWQGIDPAAAIRQLKGAIYHFHAKDVQINEAICRVNGVLETKKYSDGDGRSWLFRTVGEGHGESVWLSMLAALTETGYDDVLSIEHEDVLLPAMEGVRRAISFLKRILGQ